MEQSRRHYAIVFLVLAPIDGVPGFGSTVGNIARILFVTSRSWHS